MGKNRWVMRIVCALSIVILLFSFSGTLSVQAQDPLPPCDGRNCPAEPGLAGQALAGLKYYTRVTQKGFYVASGVGMANLGYGTIEIPPLPPDSIVSRAYLFWGIIGTKTEHGFNYARGTFNGHVITGTLIGTTRPSSWYGPDNKYYAYRADVRAYVNHTGTGSYPLSGFASGSFNGEDPWLQAPYTAITYPLLDGASLVIIYSNPRYPTTSIQIYNGASLLNSATKSHLSITGVNAAVPSGLATTTFIAGEGVYESIATADFLATPLPTITLTGLDPNGKGTNYSKGNFWDTQTVDMHSLVNPPETNFDFTLTKSGWAGMWVAQVLAYSNGAQDTDGDGLPDGWELNGFDANGDHFVDVPINAMGANSADMFHKDLYVEADYMNGAFLPPKAKLDDIVAVFNAAPVSNPNGVMGIHIHIDTGGADATNPANTFAAYDMDGGDKVASTDFLGIMQGANCTNYSWNDFQGYKNTYFNGARTPIFHYMIFANSLPTCLGGSSGISRNGSTDATFIKGAMDFIVSLGSWTAHGTVNEREGTFIHELGHNLGLRHGGNDHINYKPNYESVMNYLYQTLGVYRNGGVYFDYSRLALGSLYEPALYEYKGLGTLAQYDGYGAAWFCPNGDRKNSIFNINGFDWNCNLGIDATAVKVDLNRNGAYSTLAGSQNNWASITFKGNGAVGNAAAATGEVSAQGPATTPWVSELTEDQAQQAPNWTP
jgi:hypothetical protein